MNNEKINSSRATFVKKLTLAVASVFGLTFAGFNVQNLRKQPPEHLKPLSKKQANELIRNINAPMIDQIKPEPPPKVREINTSL